MTDPIIVVEAAGMAAVYSVVMYSKRYAGDREGFQTKKFAATVIVGALCGVAIVLAGDTVSQAALEARLAAYAGVVVIVENALKALARETGARWSNTDRSRGRG